MRLKRRFERCGIILLMMMLLIGMVFKNNTTNVEIEESEVPLASGMPAQFYLNNTSYTSEKISYPLCKKVGGGSISYQGSSLYDKNGLKDYILEEPDVSTYISKKQSVRWVRIYKSLSKYYVIGEIYDISNVDGASESIDSNDFAHTVGKDIYINDKKYLMQGVVASNDVACSPKVYDIDMMAEEDYEEIAALGFNTVRFLFNYNMLEDDSKPYVYKQTGWDWFDMNLKWAEKHGIRLIIDCHLSTGGIPSKGQNQNVWVKGEPNQERLVAMWSAISERYKNNTTVLGYGILNEPIIDNGDANAWNQLSNRLIQTIRENDKNHMLLIQRAQMSDTREYVYPKVEDDNWVLEVHKYPATSMKFLERYFSIPEEFLYYGNDNIVRYREDAKSVETNKTTKEITAQTGITNNWTEYSFDFVAGDSNNANLFFEIINMTDKQCIEMKDISVMCEDEELYNLKYNTENSYYLWSKNKEETLTYDAINNYISLSGPVSYISLQDTGFYRYFRVEKGKKYNVSFKLKSSTGISNITKIKVSAKEYKTSNIYYLNKQYMEMLMDCTDIQQKYNVPIFYGEIGILRYAYDEDRGIEQLSSDILQWLHDNSCHFTWFTWHEPTFGIYFTSGIEPKDNPNTLLLKQMKDIFSRE